jgi:cytochrome c biogenesis protein CcdA
MGWLSLETNERKNIALWMMFGASVIFTIYAFLGLWIVAAFPKYVFWLAVVAHIQIFSIMCGFIAQLVKRRITAGREGVSIVDEGVTHEESNV